MQEHFDQVAEGWDAEEYRHQRARLVATHLRQQIPLDSTMHVLEFGCGTGLLGFNLLPYAASVTFADTSEGMLAQVSKKIQQNDIRNASTLRLEIDRNVLSQQYDVIVSLMTLHHIEDYEAAIEIFTAHLTAGGWLGIADLDKEDGSFHQDADVPHNGFERPQLHQLFSRYGLTEIQESTPYVIKKQIRTTLKEFPVFLMTARKESLAACS